MKIYRIEHTEVCNPDTNHPVGPFITGNMLSVAGVSLYHEALDYSEQENPGRHPTPSGDGMACFNDSLVIGCRTLEDLWSWFPSREGRQALHDGGYCLRCYTAEVPVDQTGGMQVAFNPTTVEETVELDIISDMGTSCVFNVTDQETL